MGRCLSSSVIEQRKCSQIQLHPPAQKTQNPTPSPALLPHVENAEFLPKKNAELILRLRHLQYTSSESDGLVS